MTHFRFARVRLLFLWLLLFAVPPVAAQPVPTTVSGTVSLPAPAGPPIVVPGVTVTLACAGASEPRVEVSDEQGRFTFAGVAPGSCVLSAELQGFKSATRDLFVKEGEPLDFGLRLDADALHEEVSVTVKAGAADAGPITAHVERVSAETMRTAPIASERFQDALPLIPGVVRGPDGLINVNGARSNQTALVFNSSDGTDPVTGEHAVELPIDAVHAVQVRGAAYAPEFGLSAGSVTMVETEQGGESWHATVNDLEPRVRRRGGEFKGIESWTPRLTVGGPLIPNSLSVLESTQFEYTQTQVFDLPPDRSDTEERSFQSYTRADWTVTPAHRVTGSAMVSPRRTLYAALNTLNPQPVTPSIDTHNGLGSVSDHAVVGTSGVLETSVSVKRYDATIYPSVGRSAMVLAPDVNGGSYFNDQDRTSRRVEALTTYAFTPAGPSHLLKIGGGGAYESFDGVSRSRPVDIVRSDGSTLREIAFSGSGSLRQDRRAVRAFAQDAWTASPRLTLMYGLRYDYDSATGDHSVAPRGSFTLLGSGDGRTVVRAGGGVFYDPLPLNVASFVQTQNRVVTDFATDGLTIAGGPVVLANALATPLRTPRSASWNVEVDREWLENFFVRVSYLQRDDRFQPVVDLSDGGDAVLLRGDGVSRYREAQITGRFALRGTDQIVGSYTRSRATGSLNDFNSYFGNVENPVITPDERGPLAWDAPNRFLFWSNVSLPARFTVFPLVDVRTGFPLSITDESRAFVGGRNEAGRYPRFVSVDLQVSKRLRLFNHDAVAGIKVFNLTDHFNPRDYQGNLAAASFGRFANSVGRTFRGKWVFEF